MTDPAARHKNSAVRADVPAVRAGARTAGRDSASARSADTQQSRDAQHTEDVPAAAPEVAPACHDPGPWYRDGLKFRCTGCGDCCTGGEGYVWVDDDEIAAIARYLNKPAGEIRLMYCRPIRHQVSLNEYANGDCVFFDPEQRNCRIYPVRPVQCRTWPFWRSNLTTESDWQSVVRDCPGAGTGDLIPLEEIEIRVAERDL